MIYALIPAAGHSSRMGRPKLALPLAGRTVLEHLVGAVRHAGVDPILVVVGPHVPQLVPLAEAAGASALLLPSETSGMRATVQAGLGWLEKQFRPRAEDFWLLVPADHPTLEPPVIRHIIQARPPDPRHSIVLPTYRGQRGHPVLIAWKHVARIRTLPPEQGLNVYMRQQEGEIFELPVDSPAVVTDLDTPEDYERLVHRLRLSVEKC